MDKVTKYMGEAIHFEKECEKLRAENAQLKAAHNLICRENDGLREQFNAAADKMDRLKSALLEAKEALAEIHDNLKGCDVIHETIGSYSRMSDFEAAGVRHSNALARDTLARITSALGDGKGER